MPCYHPIPAFLTKDGRVIFHDGGGVARFLSLPCGRCVGCRLERSRQWAVRILHETKCHEQNCFLTLTYDDAHLPRDRSLDYSVFQKFMKRFRKRIGVPVRFYMCGEYGEQFDRPHYHACIFGYDFPDKVVFSETRGNELWTSPLLESLWPYGFSTVGAVTFESAAYVARYCVKKVNGDLAKDHYRLVDVETGEIFDRVPEFGHMSLKNGGIGAAWLRKYMSDVYPRDFVLARGHKSKPPRYYDVMYRRHDRAGFDALKDKRVVDMRDQKRYIDCTARRLADRKECAEARVNLYRRTL